MKLVTKILFTDDNGIRFFGEGPCRLLRCIERTGSVRKAAMEMEMAYSKASKILKQAEENLGFSLTTRSAGGKDGGGSVLTPEGKLWLQQYEQYRDACIKVNQTLFRQHFPKVGCVIMASGLGKRFGSNKLMADFQGKPMILAAVNASRSFGENRVVVTRHQDVAELCRELGVNVILHDLPHRSDTVRLGLDALGDVDACVFLPADQPLLRPETVDLLVSHWKVNQQRIVRPIHKDVPGAPVVFPKWAFEELRSLPEGEGGGWVMKQHPESVEAVPIRDPFELMDADNPETLEMLQRQFERMRALNLEEKGV